MEVSKPGADMEMRYVCIRCVTEDEPDITLDIQRIPYGRKVEQGESYHLAPFNSIVSTIQWLRENIILDQFSSAVL